MGNSQPFQPGHMRQWASLVLRLAVGMSVAGKFDTTAGDYTYVLICCAGLLLSRYDRIRIDACGSAREHHDPSNEARVFTGAVRAGRGKRLWIAHWALDQEGRR